MLQVGGLWDDLECLNLGLLWGDAVVADVEAQKLNAVGAEDALLWVHLEVDSVEGVADRRYVQQVLLERSAVHQDVVDVALGAVRQVAQYVVHDALEDGGRLLEAEG